MSVESIHKAPVYEAFSAKCGCPVCRIYDRYERNAITVLMEEGVMDYNIRVKTNSLGFCDRHMDMICNGSDTLSASLMFTTYVEKHLEAVLAGKSVGELKREYGRVLDGCYICDTVDKLMNEVAEFISVLYKEREFQKLFRAQELFCARHTAMLLGHVKLSGRDKRAYFEDIKRINSDYARKTLDKLKAYSTSFDYRNAGRSVKDVKDCNKDVLKLLK